MTIGDPTSVITIMVPDGTEFVFSALATLSVFLIVRAVWRSIAGG